ncbi:MAG: 4-hydroxy-tetrahydrodipicolinate reductase, partial [Selenomonadaceae bacterium]|nr:4-hydroxy-tetrahydrodipicolinate reductase [Selenomonadaceae bacterium]
MIKVLVNGALGRMGRTVCGAVKADSDLELVGAVDVIAGEVEGLQVETDLDAALKKFSPEVMVDFTRPNVVFQNVMTALANKVSPVVGTTGLSDEAKEKIRARAEENQTPAFIAPNFALGAVLMMLTAQKIAKYMPDVEIIELHHDKKLDAPSGTAELTAKMISEVRPPHKQGHPDEEERLAHVRGADFDGIKIHSVRLPGYVAHQEVIFG